MQPRVITIDPESIARALGLTALVVLIASIGGQVATTYLEIPFVRTAAAFLYVDNEKNLPTAFAVFLLLFAFLLLATVATLERQARGSWARHWALLTAGFAVMAIDEAWSLHERLIRPGRTLLGGGEHGVFFYAWVLFGIALLIVLVPVFLRFLISLPAATRTRFIAAGALFVGGAIGTELLAGLFNEHFGLHLDKGGYGVRHLQYSFIATVEEGLEFAGSIFFIRALLLYCAEQYGGVLFRSIVAFQAGRPKSSPASGA
jgi:hypothetical protein